MTGAKIRNDLPLGLSFHSLWSFAIPRQQKSCKNLEQSCSYLPNWYGINVKSFNSTDLCLVSEFPAMTLSQHSINKAFTTRQIFLCPVLGIKGLKIEKGEHYKADTCWYQRAVLLERFDCFINKLHGLLSLPFFFWRLKGRNKQLFQALF